jgi:hypothetical protein
LRAIAPALWLGLVFRAGRIRDANQGLSRLAVLPQESCELLRRGRRGGNRLFVEELDELLLAMMPSRILGDLSLWRDAADLVGVGRSYSVKRVVAGSKRPIFAAPLSQNQSARSG